ncbi:MAG: hypothetical protein F6K10_38375, partial [Moorea sp. SIO2B7]|nr:hypothetical protein [Moorena sp. SIO2B7]
MLDGADYSETEIALESAPATEQEEEGLKVELLETSFEKIKPRADEFVESFYDNLFTMYPAAKPLFEHTNMAKQKNMLLSALVMVVDNLRLPEALDSSLKGLGARHVKYGALPEHYPLVGNALLTTFEQFLESDWTEEVKQAWVDAYGAISNIMLDGADYSETEIALESAPAPAQEEEAEIALESTPTLTKEEEEEETGLKVAILESSFEKIKPRAEEFVNSFYYNLFTMYPAARPLFEHTNMAKQKKMLLSALVMVVDNLRLPEVLDSNLKGLGARHVKYGALPEHYPLVGNALLTTFEQFLESDWTEEVKQAWVDAYGAISTIMLDGADYSETEIALESAPAPAQEEEETGLKVALLESSFEKIKPRAEEFVNSFYYNLFTMYPAARPLFEHTDMAKQKKMLLSALVMVVDNLRVPEALDSSLKGLGARHVKYGALPEHYPLVGNALLTTFEQFLGSDWTEEVKQAWVDAYGAISTIMLDGADYSETEIALESAPAPAQEEEGLKVELLETSFEKIKPIADEFVDSFYDNLFTMYPAAKPLFEHTNMAKQKKMLLSALVMVVDNLRVPEVLDSSLKGLGARHVKYGALPEHYPLVGNALLTTFEQFLGSDWTEEVKQAWVDA